MAPAFLSSALGVGLELSKRAFERLLRYSVCRVCPVSGVAWRQVVIRTREMSLWGRTVFDPEIGRSRRLARVRVTGGHRENMRLKFLSVRRPVLNASMHYDGSLSSCCIILISNAVSGSILDGLFTQQLNDGWGLTPGFTSATLTNLPLCVGRYIVIFPCIMIMPT